MWAASFINFFTSSYLFSRICCVLWRWSATQDKGGQILGGQLPLQLSSLQKKEWFSTIVQSLKSNRHHYNVWSLYLNFVKEVLVYSMKKLNLNCTLTGIYMYNKHLKCDCVIILVALKLSLGILWLLLLLSINMSVYKLLYLFGKVIIKYSMKKNDVTV